MGAVFGNITVMQFADLLILFGLLVLIIVLAVLIAAHFSGSRRQQKLILSHIDGTITEIRDAVVADSQKKQPEDSPDPEEKQKERKALTVVRIDNRIGTSSKENKARKPAVVRIDGRVEAEPDDDSLPENSVNQEQQPEQQKQDAQSAPMEQYMRTGAASVQQSEETSAAESAEKAAAKESVAAETPDTEPGSRQPEDMVPEEHVSRNIRYRSRDCGVDKNGKSYSVDQLRDQIR